MRGGKWQVGYSLYNQKTSAGILIKLESKDGFQAGNVRGECAYSQGRWKILDQQKKTLGAGSFGGGPSVAAALFLRL